MKSNRHKKIKDELVSIIRTSQRLLSDEGERESISEINL